MLDQTDFIKDFFTRWYPIDQVEKDLDRVLFILVHYTKLVPDDTRDTAILYYRLNQLRELIKELNDQWKSETSKPDWT